MHSIALRRSTVLTISWIRARQPASIPIKPSASPRYDRPRLRERRTNSCRPGVCFVLALVIHATPLNHLPGARPRSARLAKLPEVLWRIEKRFRLRVLPPPRAASAIARSPGDRSALQNTAAAGIRSLRCRLGKDIVEIPNIVTAPPFSISVSSSNHARKSVTGAVPQRVEQHCALNLRSPESASTSTHTVLVSPASVV